MAPGARLCKYSTERVVGVDLQLRCGTNRFMTTKCVMYKRLPKFRYSLNRHTLNVTLTPQVSSNGLARRSQTVGILGTLQKSSPSVVPLLPFKMFTDNP